MAKGKGGSKALTGILCFIFGFLFAIIVEAALIGGGIYFLLNADIDNLLSTVGVDNYDEETGKNIYINTNVEEGGVEKVTDLLDTLKGFADKGKDELTIGDFTSLFPVGDTFIDGIYSSLANALAGYDITEEDLREIIDEEQLKATPVASLGEFFRECGQSVKVETVMQIAGIDVAASPVYLAVAYGDRASVMYSVEDGSATALYADEFAYEDGAYIREDGQALGAELEEYLVARSDGSYALYYSVGEDGTAEAARYADGMFVPSGAEYTLYSEETAKLSGGYYYDSEGALIVLHARTIGEISEEESMTIENAIGMVYLADLLGDISADNAVMAYMVYGISDIKAADGGMQLPDGVTHTAVYHILGEDGEPVTDSDGNPVTKEAYVVTEGGVITDVYYLEETADGSGIKLGCNTTVDESVGRIDGLKDDMTIGELLGDSGDGDNVLLDALRDSTINSLADDINSLSIQELFADEIYGEGSEFVPVAGNEEEAAENPGSVVFDMNYLYYYFDGTEYVLLNGEITPPTGVDSTTAINGHLSGDHAYSIAVSRYGTIYTRGRVQGVWSLFLYEDYAGEGEISSVGEQLYYINDVAKMQLNVTANLRTTTLGGFMEMGIISETSEGTLSMSLDRFEGVGGYEVPEGKDTIGDLTISEFIQLIGALGTHFGQNP